MVSSDNGQEGQRIVHNNACPPNFIVCSKLVPCLEGPLCIQGGGGGGGGGGAWSGVAQICFQVNFKFNVTYVLQAVPSR